MLTLPGDTIAMKLPTNKYGTHTLYPYRGAMHPGLARHMIQLCDPIYKDRILDPFCGSGTIPVEAVMLGYNCTALDVLPTAVVATQVKTHFAPGEEPDMDTPETRLHMAMARKADLLSAHSDIVQSFDEMRRLVEQQDLRIGECETHVVDTKQMHYEKEYDHIITSPPYGALIDYVEESTAALMALGMTREQIEDIRARTLPLTIDSMTLLDDLAHAFRKALRPTGSICIAIGRDQFGNNYPDRWAQALEDAGLVRHCGFVHRYDSLVNQIPSEEVMHYILR